jgi:hypothetical protein
VEHDKPTRNLPRTQMSGQVPSRVMMQENQP